MRSNLVFYLRQTAIDLDLRLRHSRRSDRHQRAGEERTFGSIDRSVRRSRSVSAAVRQRSDLITNRSVMAFIDTIPAGYAAREIDRSGLEIDG